MLFFYPFLVFIASWPAVGGAVFGAMLGFFAAILLGPSQGARGFLMTASLAVLIGTAFVCTLTASIEGLADCNALRNGHALAMAISEGAVLGFLIPLAVMWDTPRPLENE